MIHVLSLGAGVQSSTLALMFAKGELTPMPNCAIFADTQAEPAKVYEWLNWLEKQLPYPVHRVSAGSLHDDQLSNSKSKDGHEYLRNLIPAFAFTDGQAAEGMLLRKCTGEYKLAPLRRKAKEVMLAAGATAVTQYIGISWDEAHRMKSSGVKYVTHAYPLIDRAMTRGHCLEWMRRQGYAEPPKSACIFCPYHNDEQWKALPPDELAKAAAFEREWNVLARADTHTSQTRATIRLHRSGKPIDQVDFNTSPSDFGQVDAFGNECEGMCGV